MPSDGKTKIVILGGGFGGLYTALHLEKTLARDSGVEITLVNKENFILFTPMLHEVAASDLDMTHIVNPIRKLLKRVRFFDGDVQEIDLPNKRVHVSHGLEAHEHILEYDHLVLALGAITNFFNIPGLQERAITMKSLGDAIHLRNNLIEIRVKTRVKGLTADGVELNDGTIIKTKTLVWTAGTSPNPLFTELPCKKDKGKIITNSLMEVPDWPGVWAVGDCAVIPDPQGKPYPPTAQHALRQGKVLAQNITAAIRGGRKKPFIEQRQSS